MNVPDSIAAAIRSLGMSADGVRPVEGFTDVPYWAIPIAGVQALNAWQQLSAQAGATGFWPVIVGNFGGEDFGGADGAIEQFAERAQDIQQMQSGELDFHDLKRTPAEYLETARNVPLEAWAQRRRDPGWQSCFQLRRADYFQELEGGEALAKIYREMAANCREWAEHLRQQPKWHFDPDEFEMPPAENSNPPQHQLSCNLVYDAHQRGGVVADDVAILLLPTPLGWQAPAYLFYAASEYERPPQVHVAALKWLFDRFGAQLIGVQDRVLEVIPESAGEALAAADTLSTYSNCPATSSNECASIPELAVYLMESAVWSFCWP